MHKHIFVDINKNVLSKFLIFAYVKYFWSYVELTRTQFQYIWSSLLLLCARFISFFLKNVPLLTSPRSYTSSSTPVFIIFFTIVLFWKSYSAIWVQIIFCDVETHFCNDVCILSPKQSLFFRFMWQNVHTCLHFSPDICDTTVPLFLR
jgi:hypothetical protein